jgi:catechol 2,3-dioxygenase-like lactoylglutathione lyase family enzyme
MVGIIVEDMARSLAFYRQLGLDIPAEADDRTHVEFPLADGLTLFWNAFFVVTDDPGRAPPAGGYRMVLEFFLESQGAVDAKYAELIDLGHRGHRAPFVASFGAYMAMVDDPDGNTILITAG